MQFTTNKTDFFRKFPEPGIDLDHLSGRVFSDKASGKDTKRPELEAFLAFTREGDIVVVHSMDRLARNLDDLRQLAQFDNPKNYAGLQKKRKK